jgi:iron(III) transport system permease protein
MRASRRIRDNAVVGVAALAVGILAALPIGYLAWRGFEYGFSSSFKIATSSRTINLLRSTLLLAIAVTTASVVLALPIAWLTVRTNVIGRNFWSVVTVLPLAIPTYVGSWAMIGALGPRGMFSNLLGVQSIPSIYGFWGAWASLTLFSYPYVLLTVRAVWVRLDPSLEEASRMLGRSSWQTFVHVVWPQLRPAASSGALLVALYSLSDFGAVTMMRYDTFTREIYLQYRGALERGATAVLGLMLVVLTVTVLTGEQRLRKREDVYRLHGSGARNPQLVDLKRLQVPALAGLGILTTLALVVPLGVISYWIARGVRANEPVWPAWSLISNSLSVSLLAAAVTTVAAIPVALFIRRSPGRFANIVERLSWSGYALPGIVVALALVYLGANALPWAYQSMGMLIFGYSVLFLPQAIGAVRSSLLQVTPSLEEASLLLGTRRITTFRKVLLPLLRPGLGAGAGLVFLTTMKELPATLLLSPTGFSTLATRIWNSTSEGFLGRSAGSALTLVLLSSVPMSLFIVRNQAQVLRPSHRPNSGHDDKKAKHALPSDTSDTR